MEDGGMMMRLTEGAIEKMKNGATADSFKPVLQVTDLRLISSSQNTQERYRVVISDGTHGQQGMLGTQKNDLVKSKTLQIGSIVQLTQYTFNVIQGRSIIIIIELNVILDKCDPIGETKQNVINPMAAPAQVPSITHSGLVPSNLPPNAGNSYSGGSLGGNSEPGRYNASKSNPMYPTSETGTGNMGNNTRTPMNNYGRQPQPSYQQPPPMYMNRGPIAKNEAPPRIIPIAALNPYQGRWTIKARVTAKSELRRYNNARGDGKVFSFDLLDSDGGEIRSTCFNAVADQFYNQIEVGKIYLISKGSLRPAQKAFNHLRNEHEIMLESMSTVQPCLEDDKSIPPQQFHFRPIADVESLANNDVVDLIGVVSYVSPSSSIMKKNGEETQKRTLHLKDMSGRSVELTLWGNFCNSEGLEVQNMCDSGVFPVLAVKAGRVSDFNGKSVGTLSSSQLIIDPDFPEAYKLKQWFEKEGKNIPAISLSRETSVGGKSDVNKTISQIKDENLGTSEKPDWITVKASISFIKADNFCYTACPVMIGDRQCNKKVTNNGDGKWRCDRCDQTVDTCDYRYILQFQIQDHTGLTWVTAFQESGVDIMGVSAKDLYFLKYEEQDDEKFAEITHQVLFNKYSFKLKVKEETFSDERRVKSTVVKAEKVNYSSECKLLLQIMNKPQDGSGSAVPVPDYLSNISTNKGNQHSGSSVAPSGSARTYMNVSCNLCGGTGHTSANCPTLSSFGTGITSNSGGGGSIECYKCHQYGHWARDCPGSENVSSYDGGNVVGGGGGGASECYKCHQTGHWARDCPGSNTVSSYGGGNIGGGGGGGGGSTECYKCHQFGHWARDCPGLGNATPAYGSGGSRPRVGGF